MSGMDKTAFSDKVSIKVIKADGTEKKAETETTIINDPLQSFLLGLFSLSEHETSVFDSLSEDKKREVLIAFNEALMETIEEYTNNKNNGE